MDDDRLSFSYSLKGKRVWVAGHNGMVGAAVMRRLQIEDCEILSADKSKLDLRDQQKTQIWVKQNKPDVIVIAAAKVGGILANATYPAEFIYDNLMIEINIMQAAYQAGVQRLLCLGSSCIYPKNCPQPIREEYLLTGELEPTNEAYAIAKIVGLKMAQFYRQQYGCDFISAMPCNLYGIGDTYDEKNSHVIPALIMKAHKAKISGDRHLTVWGAGRALREFLEVDELADALIFLLKHYASPQHINVGSGQEISIANLAQTICEALEFKGNIIFDATKPDGTPRKVMDITRLTECGWQARLCLKDGINKSCKDFLGRYSNDRGQFDTGSFGRRAGQQA